MCGKTRCVVQNKCKCAVKSWMWEYTCDHHGQIVSDDMGLIDYRMKVTMKFDKCLYRQVFEDIQMQHCWIQKTNITHQKVSRLFSNNGEIRAQSSLFFFLRTSYNYLILIIIYLICYFTNPSQFMSILLCPVLDQQMYFGLMKKYCLILTFILFFFLVPDFEKPHGIILSNKNWPNPIRVQCNETLMFSR